MHLMSILSIHFNYLLAKQYQNYILSITYFTFSGTYKTQYDIGMYWDIKLYDFFSWNIHLDILELSKQMCLFLRDIIFNSTCIKQFFFSHFPYLSNKTIPQCLFPHEIKYISKEIIRSCSSYVRRFFVFYLIMKGWITNMTPLL